MPREFLLALVALAILLNVGLLLAIVLVRTRQRWPRPATRPVAATVAVTAPPPAIAEPPVPEPAGLPPDLAPAPRPAPIRSTARRSRRFVMPSLEEDHERATRAIGAVLGDTGHRTRRRSRRHRGPGPLEHTAVDARIRGMDELRRTAGPDIAGRMALALAASVGSAIRSSDRLIDFGDGRLRVIVQADPEGAGAASDRIRAMTGPWLATAAVPIELLMVQAEPEAPGPVRELAGRTEG
jgi:hypothetical protein